MVISHTCVNVISYHSWCYSGCKLHPTLAPTIHAGMHEYKYTETCFGRSLNVQLKSREDLGSV